MMLNIVRGLLLFWMALVLMGSAATVLAQSPANSDGRVKWLAATSERDEHDRARQIFVEGIINDEHRQRFLVDTGATISVIPYEAAKKLNITCIETQILTVEGGTDACYSYLNTLNIDGVVIKDTPVIYIPSENLVDKDTALLGLSALSDMRVKFINGKLYFQEFNTQSMP